MSSMDSILKIKIYFIFGDKIGWWKVWYFNKAIYQTKLNKNKISNYVGRKGLSFDVNCIKI